MDKKPQETKNNPANILKNRAIAEVIEKENLIKKLNLGKGLRIKFGADPSRPDLHLGHSIILKILRSFQNAGHTIIFVIGDYTAMIGDPSGKSKTRPALSKKEAEQNAKTYFDQVKTILDVKKTEVRFNSEWFSVMALDAVLQLTSRFTVARILERDDFAKRLNNNTDIGAQELLYPMMQAFDSVVLSADVEIGGTDQKFNMLAGRELQKKMGQTPQDIIMTKILVGTDGKEKMSKSLDNFISLGEQPQNMHAKIMSVSDGTMMDYFELLSDFSDEEIAGIKNELKNEKINPKKIKEKLARHIVSFYYGKKKADEANNEFNRVFTEKESPKNIEKEVLIKKEETLLTLIRRSSLVKSNAQIHRLFKQGAIDVDGEKIEDPLAKITVPAKDGVVVRIGKKIFFKIKPGK